MYYPQGLCSKFVWTLFQTVLIAHIKDLSSYHGSRKHCTPPKKRKEKSFVGYVFP